MPLLIRRDAIRLLEASVEALDLATASLGSCKRYDFRETSAQFAIEIGLVGVSAELAMAACLVNGLGPSALVWPSGQFKTFGEIQREFRTFVTSAPPSSNFLVLGTENANNHRSQLAQQSQHFRRLAVVRAGGLHAGRGLLWEATVVQANAVSDFLGLLAKSSRICPYLEHIPRCILLAQERMLIVEDLARRLAQSSEEDRSRLLRSLYLVLPDVPEEQPEWLDSLHRITVCPRDRDVCYLLDVMEHAVPVTLRRSSRSGTGLAVVVRPGDESALPIAPQYLRRQFNEIRDQWFADIATANGRLGQGVLDLPPVEAVRDVFALGLDESRVLQPGQSFTGHEAWPFVASSISNRGTLGPYWFIVRRTIDLGQLSAQLEQASRLGGAAFRRNLEECHVGVDAIQNNRVISTDEPSFAELLSVTQQADLRRASLSENLARSRNTDREFTDEVFDAQLIDAVENLGSIGPILSGILDSPMPQGAKAYWSRVLSDSASLRDDLPVLLRVLGEQFLAPAHTAARKAIRRIDFLLYGPPAEVPHHVAGMRN